MSAAREIPNPKHQIPTKQTKQKKEKSAKRAKAGLALSSLGSTLFGIWCLGFGIFAQGIGARRVPAWHPGEGAPRFFSRDASPRPITPTVPAAHARTRTGPDPCRTRGRGPGRREARRMDPTLSKRRHAPKRRARRSHGMNPPKTSGRDFTHLALWMAATLAGVVTAALLARGPFFRALSRRVGWAKRSARSL